MYEDIQTFNRWWKKLMQHIGSGDMEVSNSNEQNITTIEEEAIHMDENFSDVLGPTITHIGADRTFMQVDVSNFHDDQLRVYAIVTHHLEATLCGEEAEQLFMILSGEGGTGKSHVIHAIAQYLESHNATQLLAMGAYTGIAASLIGGKTCKGLV
jgi:Cdc6-like AAA superfamily ATPase